MSDRYTYNLPEIEGYLLQKEIGRGGVGVVYSAQDLETDDLVAIKVMKVKEISSSDGSSPSYPSSSGPNHTASNANSLNSMSASSIGAQRLFQELIAATRIQHRNVVQITDFGVADNDDLYIVMEFLHGHDMSYHLKHNGALSARQTVALFKEMLSALSVAHEQNLVHQDLKPSNLFLAEEHGELRLVVTDFGIARRIKQNHTSDELMGSLPYMAPEYLKHRVIHTSGDVYQLGLTFIELLTGKRVIQRKGAIQIMYQHLSADFELHPALQHKRIGKLIRKSIHVEAKQRFQTAQELLDALDELSHSDIECLEFELRNPDQVKIEAEEHLDVQRNDQKSQQLEEHNKTEPAESDLQESLNYDMLKVSLLEATQTNTTLKSEKEQLLERINEYHKRDSRQRILLIALVLVLAGLCIFGSFYLL